MTTTSKVRIGDQTFPALNVDGHTMTTLEPVLQALGRPWQWDQAAEEVVIQPESTRPAPLETWGKLADRMGAVAELSDWEVRLLCATVEAETNGDNRLIEWDGEAVGGAGFGQVWARWHAATVVRAMEMLKRPALPGVLTGDPNVCNAVLLYDAEVSMLTVAMLIKNMWNAAQWDWDRFTELYVGAGISAEDRARRRVIWERWKV